MTTQPEAARTEARHTGAGRRMTIAEVREWLAKAEASGLPDDTQVGAILVKRTQLIGLVAPPAWLPAGERQDATPGTDT